MNMATKSRAVLIQENKDDADIMSKMDLEELQANLPAYLSFLTKQYMLPFGLQFNYIEADDEVSKKSRTKPAISESYKLSEPEKLVNIWIAIDQLDRPVKIIFKEPVTRQFLKLVGYAIQKHTLLHSIEFTGVGHTHFTIYEINKIVLNSQITHVSFDGTQIRNANYHILLDEVTNLKSLSLARCSITNSMLEDITKRLEYEKPAAKTLRILNLSANLINDEGALILSKMLETNRCLCYLNLSNNEITDLGAIAILTTLHSFRITDEEFRKARRRHLTYLQERQKAAKLYLKKLRSDDNPDTYNKTKNKPKKLGSKTNKLGGLSGIVSDRTLAKAEEQMSYLDFDYPIYVDATPLPGGGANVRGNGVICRLNLAYNSVTELTLARAVPIMKAAVEGHRTVFLICIEGAQLPKTSELQKEVDRLTDLQLSIYGRKLKEEKSKKLQSKSKNYS